MPEKTVRLRAAMGQDDASYGTRRFRVEADGTIEVPLEAVESLTRVGGFVLDPAPASPPPTLWTVGG